jgi:hypothetical protein
MSDSRSMARRKRCDCHKKDRKRGVVLACDVMLGVLAAFCVILLLVYFVLPRMGITPDLSVVTRANFNGLLIALVGVGLNILWAVYYGCQKSVAGVGLSVVTAAMVAHSYGIV